MTILNICKTSSPEFNYFTWPHLYDSWFFFIWFLFFCNHFQLHVPSSVAWILSCNDVQQNLNSDDANLFNINFFFDCVSKSIAQWCRFQISAAIKIVAKYRNNVGNSMCITNRRVALWFLCSFLEPLKVVCWKSESSVCISAFQYWNRKTKKYLIKIFL